MQHTPVSPGAPEARPDARTRRRVAAALVAAVVLAGCGSSGGGAAAPTTTAAPKATTSTTSTTVAEDDASPTADEEEAVDEGDDAGEAPSGLWLMVRYQVAQEPDVEDFTAGQAESRVYDIEPDCDDEGCTLTLAGGGEDGSFALNDLEPITGDPIVLEPDGDGWSSTYAEEPYGCTDALDGPYVESVTELEVNPIRNDDGAVVAMRGRTTYTDTTTPEGEAAGCPETSVGVYTYDSIYVPGDNLEELPDFEVDGEYVQTLEIVSSEGYTEEPMQPGALSTSLEAYRFDVSGSCEDGDCDVDVAIPLGGGNGTREVALTDDGETLDGDFADGSGCYDPATGETVFQSGAYETEGSIMGLVPVLVVEDRPVVFIGRYSSTVTPTELGLTDPACSEVQTFDGWTTWVSPDLLDA